MYIKTFLNKLGGAFTRILILVLVISMLIPMELLSVMDLGEDGTATSNAYSIVAGNSGSVATHGLPNSCGIINNFKCGFKVGVVFDDGMLVDAKHSVENLIIENGRGFTMIDSGTFILPQSLTKENKWVVGYYDASSMDISYKPENLDKITFTNRTNGQTSKVGDGHVFYKEILDSMKKDEGAFMSKDWQTILEKGPTNKNKCLDNWEYLLGWSGKSFAINSRFNECFNKDENGFENISEWGGDKEKVLDEKANYLDMLYQLYTISGSEPIKTNIKKAIEILVKDEFASNPFGLVIQPLVVLGPMDRYGTTMVINTNDFLQYICGITSSNGLTRPQFENYIMNEKPDLAGSYYGMLREATNKSIREHPTAFREADEWQGYPDHHVVWDWASTGVGWKSIKLSKVIVPGRYPNVGWNWGTAGSTDADMHESAWLNAWINSSNINATMDPNGHKDFKGMYGLNIVYYVNGVAAEASLGKLQALPDEKVVHKTQEDTHFGEVVDLKLFTGVDNEKERAEWDNIIKLAKEDKSFAGFHITAKLSRTTDVPEWKGLPTNFLTDWVEPKINNIKAEVMDEMIKGNTPILENKDDISSYPVPKGEKAVLHYKADVLVTAKIGDKDYKWKISPASDGMDDASFIIDNKATKKERIRYISTQTAFAELKNYGKGSNQSGNLSETYEVMAGVPTTEQLYYAAGGSEFIVDVSLEYCNNEKAVRSYTSYFSGTKCEFYEHDAMNNGATVDVTGCAPITNPSAYVMPVPTVTIPKTTYHWDDKNIVCSHENGGDWKIVASYHGDSTCGAEEGGEVWHACPSCGNRIEDNHGTLTTDDYDAAVEAANKLAETLSKTDVKWTSTSEGNDHGTTNVKTGKERKVQWTTSVTSSYDTSDHTSPGDDGLPGCGGHHNCDRSCYSCPGHGSGSTAWSHENGCHRNCVTRNCRPGSKCNGSHVWEVVMTATIPDHAVCGPCCSHYLPDIYDTWSQSWTYDSLKITDVHVWRIDQASASNLEEVIGPAVDNNVRYSLNPVTNTEGAYENPNAVEDGIVGASIKTNPPNIFYNIAMKNSNDLTGHNETLNYKTTDGIGGATESSLVGRIRYYISGSYKDANQHDEVFYDLGTRTNQCDGLAKTYATNVTPTEGTGHSQKWADGFQYNSFKGEPTTSGTNQSDGGGNSVNTDTLDSKDTYTGSKDFRGLGTHGMAYGKVCGQTKYPLNQRNYLEAHCDGVDSEYARWTKRPVSPANKNFDVNTVEYKKLQEMRNQPIQAEMITDFLVLQTTSGDQSVMYYACASPLSAKYVNGSDKYLPEIDNNGKPVKLPGGDIVTLPITADSQIPSIYVSKKMMWDENIKGRGGEYFGECASNWDPNEINIGGYNGNYRSPGDKFVGSGDGHDTKTRFDGGDPATGAPPVDKLPGVIVRPTRPARPLMLYSLPINIITEIENKQYLVDGLESEVFWTNNLHWSDVTSESYSVNTNPMTPDYSVTSHKEDARFEFSNHKDLITTWGQDNSNVANSYRGIIDDTHYSPNHAMELNGLVIQDQISTTDSSLISLPNSRDQRYAEIIGAKDNNADLSKYQVCPETAEECEFAILKCHYGEGKKVAEYLFNLNNGLNSVTENSFNAATGWSFSNNKLVGSVGAKKIGIPLLTELGSSMNAGMKLNVSGTINLSELPVTRNPNGTIKTRISQMIWSFKGYGLYVSTEGKLGFITSKGQYRESTNVVLQKNRDYNIEAVMSFSGLQTCSLKVDGVDVTFTSSSKKPVKFDTSVIGEYFYFGCTGDNKCEYGFRGTMDNIVITRMPGTYNHTADCYTTTMIHPSGLNVHVHSKECLNTKPDTTTTTTTTKVLYNAGQTIYDSSTPGNSSLTLPAGRYTLEVWGAQGGQSNHGVRGGLGGYSTGTIQSSGETYFINVGGLGGKVDGGFNGGGNGGAANNDSAGGGGGSDIRRGSNSLSSRVIVAGGGGASGCSSTYGGDGGGSTAGNAVDPNTGYGGAGGPGTQYGGGSGGTNSGSGSLGQGGHSGLSQTWPGGGGGGGYYGGGAGGNTPNGGGAGGGGSGYIDGVSNGSMSTGVQSGNGRVRIVTLDVITETVQTTIQVPDKHGYEYYKALYEKGQLSIEQLKALFGDAYDILMRDTIDLSTYNSFANTNKFSDFYNCDLVAFSGVLVNNITGTSPSFVMSESFDSDLVSKIRMNIDNHTTAKKAKVYWSDTKVFTEAKSYETNMIPNADNQTINFYVDRDIDWAGQVRYIKICIPSESDINYGNDVQFHSIGFERADPKPVDFNFNGGRQTYNTDVSGFYYLETWGASGGNANQNYGASSGGHGGYSAGVIELAKGRPLYVYVGGQGRYSDKIGAGAGFNGGGSAGATAYGGGGMTHISYSPNDRITSTTTGKIVEVEPETTTLYTYKGYTESVVLQPGTYKFEAWGAEGGTGGQNSSGVSGASGKGGYSVGTYTITSPQTVYLTVGGKGGDSALRNSGYLGGTYVGTTYFSPGGYNGGGYSYNYGSGGGGASHIATSGGVLSNLSNNKDSVLIVGGGGGGSQAMYGGAGGGTTGIAGGQRCGFIGQGGTQTAGGYGAYAFSTSAAGPSGSFGLGGNGQDGNSGYRDNQFGSGGGGGWYGGGSSSSDISHTDDSGGGGGSGYVAKLSSSNGVTAQTIPGNQSFVSPTGSQETGHTGNGAIAITRIGGGNGTPKDFTYTGSVQSITLPKGVYKLETWGAQGGGSTYTEAVGKVLGGPGGYSTGVIQLDETTTLYVNVGGQGGYGGGGAGTSGGQNGGGSTHMATSYGDLHSLSNNRGAVKIVAGGGGGCEYQASPGNDGTMNSGPFPQYGGGFGGGTTGGTGLGDYSGSGNGSGGTQTSGNDFGKGGDYVGTHTGGGGGGWYGGYNGNSSNRDNHAGGGGSGYIGGVKSFKDITARTIAGNQTFPSPSGGSETGHSGNGYARITPLTYTIEEVETVPSVQFDLGVLQVAGGGGGSDATGGSDGRGGHGGGNTAGNAYTNGSLKSGTASNGNQNNLKTDSGAANGLGGNQSGGYMHGLGESATKITSAGGAGGGWWGGLVTNNPKGGGAGGSGHNSFNIIAHTDKNGKYYGIQSIAGSGSMPSFRGGGNMQGNVGDGHARISFIEAGKPNFPTIEEIIEVIDKIPENSDLVNCDRTPNTHKCDALCKEIEVLECVEPHHLGNHYQNDELCYDACMDDAKHKTSDPANTTNGMFTPGNFINIDWGYLIYYMNKGDFFQSDAHGIGNLTNTRGIGYENDMDTSTWTKIKRVRFDWNAIYEDHLYLAGEWIILADKGDYQGTDGSPYNERNWSNFGTKLYDDLYGNLLPTGAGEDRNHDGILDPVNEAVRSREGKYQFYCVEGNAEAAGARTSISAYAINNVPEWSDCADDASFDQYTTNRIRQGKRYQSMHSAYNEFYIDVVGRIGNFALIDTGDYRFSNLFKETTSSTADAVPDPTVYSVVDKSIVPTNEATIIGDDTISTKSAGSGAALLNKQFEVGNYRLSINGTGLLNSALSVKSKNAWEALEDIVGGAGMESTVVEDLGSGPNADEFIPASFTSTVTGPGSSLPAGEYNIQMVGAGMFAATWTVMDGATDITAYVEDMSVTDDLIVIRLNTPVKINNLQLSTVYKGNKEVTVDRVMISRLMENANKELTATDAVTNVAVTNTLRTYNILIKEPTAVDITSISVGLPLTVTSMSIQKISDNDESWTVEGIVRNVDESKQNAYLTWKFDIRGLPVSQATTLNIDTYSTLNWAQTRPIMPTICMTTIPLDASQNNIDVLKKEAVLVGYDAFASIGTIGNYYQNGSGFLQAIPEYYAVNVNTGEFTPVDAYIYYDNAYYPINIWGMVTNEDKLTWGDKGSGYDMNSIYNFVSTLDWDNEKDRRMVTAAEVFETNALREAFGVVSGGPDTGEPIKYLNIPMSSKYVMGNSQFLQLNGKARTFVGGETTYGTLMNYSFGGRDSSVISTDPGTGMLYNKEGRLDKEIWWKQAQRWHLKIGLPSSAVFVDSGVTPDANTIAKIQSKDYVVLSTVDIRALGDTWNLRYVQENGSINVSTKDGTVKQYDIPETITIGGKVHRIPAAITVYQTIKSSAVDVSIVGNH